MKRIHLLLVFLLLLSPFARAQDDVPDAKYIVITDDVDLFTLRPIDTKVTNKGRIQLGYDADSQLVSLSIRVGKHFTRKEVTRQGAFTRINGFSHDEACGCEHYDTMLLMQDFLVATTTAYSDLKQVVMRDLQFMNIDETGHGIFIRKSGGDSTRIDLLAAILKRGEGTGTMVLGAADRVTEFDVTQIRDSYYVNRESLFWHWQKNFFGLGQP